MPLRFTDVEFQNRYDTAANWALDNPTLATGELGFESDTRRCKLGDGSTAWNDLPYLGIGGFRWVFGDISDHTGTAVRTSKKVLTLPGGALGANGAIEVLIGARITGGTPSGPWLVEVEFGGTVAAAFQSFDTEQLHRRCLIQNQGATNVQVAQAETTRGLTEDTTADQTIEVFVTLDAGDTGLTLDLFSLEITTR